MPLNVPENASSLTLELICHEEVTEAPQIISAGATDPSKPQYKATMRLNTAAGCPVYTAKKDPYWMFGLLPLRITCGVITLLTGLTIACAGKFIW